MDPSTDQVLEQRSSPFRRMTDTSNQSLPPSTIAYPPQGNSERFFSFFFYVEKRKGQLILFS
jgi:hypothetical protein